MMNRTPSSVLTGALLLMSLLLLMMGQTTAGAVGDLHSSNSDSGSRDTRKSDTNHRPPPAPALSRDDFLVKGLEEAEPAFRSFEGTMYAGAMPVVHQSTADNNEDDDNSADNNDGHLMFWYFATDKPKVEDSLVIWFNGGPGCSSFDAGLLFEFGAVTTPLRPAGYYGGPNERSSPLQANPYGWHKATHVIFVEQPVGVGFSYGGNEPQDETDVARDFYGFLQNILDVFPELRPKRLFLVGESYAGMYAPSIAHYIYQENKKLDHTKMRDASKYVNLAGLGLGNAWVDATMQGPAVIDYAWWHGMIDSVTRDAFHQEWKNCYNPDSSHQKKKQPAPFHEFTIPDECGIMGNVLKAAGAGLFEWGAPNTYDVTTWDKYDLIMVPDSTIESFFNNPAVRAAINAPENVKHWQGCIPGAGRRRRDLSTSSQEHGDQHHRLLHLLDQDRPISVSPYLGELLDDAGISVLVYNGDRDMSTCSQGSEMVLNNMQWSGHVDWLNPQSYDRGVWLVDNYPAGWAKEVNNLYFVTVYNSGHLVPMNVPVQALDLITRLLQGESFVDQLIPVVYQPKKKSTVAEILDWDSDNKDKHESEHNDDDSSNQSFFAKPAWGFVAFVAGIVVSQLVSHKWRQRHQKRQGYEIVETHT